MVLARNYVEVGGCGGVPHIDAIQEALHRLLVSSVLKIKKKFQSGLLSPEPTSSTYQNLLFVLPSLCVTSAVASVLPLVEVRSCLGECIEVLLRVPLVLVPAQERLFNRRILNLHNHVLWLTILSVLAGDVNCQIVR